MVRIKWMTTQACEAQFLQRTATARDAWNVGIFSLFDGRHARATFSSDRIASSGRGRLEAMLDARGPSQCDARRDTLHLSRFNDCGVY